MLCVSKAWSWRDADAADLGPVIEALDQRHGRHDAQKQHEIFGPSALAGALSDPHRLEHVARPGRPALGLIAHVGSTSRARAHSVNGSAVKRRFCLLYACGWPSGGAGDGRSKRWTWNGIGKRRWSCTMAIKFGRPLERTTKLAAGAQTEAAAAKDKLDLSDPPAPQPPRRMVAAHGARERAHHRRSDLAAVPGRRHESARAGRLHAGCRAALGRRGRARRRTRREARPSPASRCFPIPSPAGATRRAPRRSIRQSRLPRHPRHQKGSAGDRRALRRRARSLYQPRP